MIPFAARMTGKALLIIFALLIGFSSPAQVKEAFEKVRQEENGKKVFAKQLLFLNRTARIGFDSAAKQTDSIPFLSVDTVGQTAILTLELPQELYDVYSDLKDDGRVPYLMKLKQEGRFKVFSRGIASDIELPARTNPAQPYSVFYLRMIQQLMSANKTVLAQDGLSYSEYKTWEASANLRTEKERADYRYAFIIFLYKQYHL